MKALIFGCGYVGMALGAELVRQGHTVWGVRRSGSARGELESLGILPVTADLTDPYTFGPLPANCEWVVNCTSASQSSPEAYRQIYLEGNRNLITWMVGKPVRKFVYTGSTGVYTQDDGGVVNEKSEILPAHGLTQILVETEQLLLESARKKALPAVILRIAGIYGPGRGYWLRKFLSGEALIEGNGGRRLNMIHRDDVAGAILVALERGIPGEVYNAVDDEAPTQLTVFEWLSRRLRRPLPPVNDAIPEGSARRRATNRIISNKKLRLELGWLPRYPTFREGYEAELERLGQG